jgi:hypothetical protein
LKNEVNNVWKKNAGWLHFIKNHHSRYFLCVLDADDEYLPDFLEKMIAFVKKNKLSGTLRNRLGRRKNRQINKTGRFG